MRPNSKKIERLLKLFPPPVARYAKKIGVPIRAKKIKKERELARAKHGNPYKHHLLFIAGLPKSGTTWLENMISSWPGLGPYLIPEVAKYELKNHESISYELPIDFSEKFKKMLSVTKMHIHASPNNLSILSNANIPWIALERDLRDVAVSYHFYVKSTPWHPSHKYHYKKSTKDGLLRFGHEVLPKYADWVRGWKHAVKKSSNGILISYEELNKNTTKALEKAAIHFGLNTDLIPFVINKNKMKIIKYAENKKNTNFERKGITGDWKNYFDEELTTLYKSICDELL